MEACSPVYLTSFSLSRSWEPHCGVTTRRHDTQSNGREIWLRLNSCWRRSGTGGEEREICTGII